MSDYLIVADSSCDLEKSLRDKYGIAEKYIKGWLVYPDGRTELADLDWNNIDPDSYFNAMKDKKYMMKTSMADPADLRGLINGYASEGHDMLIITLSSGISGTFSATSIAAREAEEKYPGRKIMVIDSKRYSTAQGLLTIYAAQLRNEGKTIEEAYEILNQKKNELHQMGFVDDLFFCNRMGRVSGTAAVMGTLVGVKPLADFGYDNGLSTVIGKTRGYKNAMAAIIEYMRETGKDLENQVVFVGHAVRRELAEQLRDRIIKEFGCKEVYISHVGQSCGTSIGPGFLAAFYFGGPMSKDNTEEKAALERALSRI